MPRPRLFLLSPASTAGKRARLLLAPAAGFALARGMRAPGGQPIGQVFSFLSGLYFRGKLTYAETFAGPESVIRIITSDRGLVPPALPVTLDDLRAMAAGAIDPDHPPYRVPLERDARDLAARLGRATEVVRLGSIATEKYTGILEKIFGARLRFPGDFVGRGDMSRGGLLLRAARAGIELEYRPLAGATRRGTRPARLGPP